MINNYSGMEIKMNRKEFFRTASRLFLLGGITASTGYLVFNNKVETACTVSTICRNCIKLTDCEEPQAKKEKNEKR